MNKKKEFTGEVVSDKMQKTIVVRVMRMAKHAKYGRTIRKYNKFKAHDEKREAKMGDVVKIIESRPLSKDKRFRLASVVKKALILHAELKEEVK
jgi:small subunit ribosomal protein S17